MGKHAIVAAISPTIEITTETKLDDARSKALSTGDAEDPNLSSRASFRNLKSDESRVRRQPGTIEIFKAVRSYRTSPGQRENRSSLMDICASLPELASRGGTELFSFAAVNMTNTALDCPP